MRMSILIWVASASLPTVQESASLKASSTDIWKVDACSVYLRERVVVKVTIKRSRGLHNIYELLQQNQNVKLTCS